MIFTSSMIADSEENHRKNGIISLFSLYLYHKRDVYEGAF